MILFRKYYKAANDEIKTNRELIDNIFDEYSKVKPKKSKAYVYAFGVRYASFAAAVLVLCVLFAVYPKLEKLNETPSAVNQQNEYLPKKSQDVAANQPIAKTYDSEPEDTASDDENTMTKMPEGRQIREVIPETENEEIKEYTLDILGLEAVSDEEINLATKTLAERLGTFDEETKNIYSFEIVGKLYDGDEAFYLGRWKWLVVDHLSMLCDFVMPESLNQLYECSVSGENVIFNTSNNLFE